MLRALQGPESDTLTAVDADFDTDCAAQLKTIISIETGK